MNNQVISIIADKFESQFKDELFEFLFAYKTEDSRACGKTLHELCEHVICQAHNISYKDYVNENDVDYDVIFGDSADLTESVIDILLQRVAGVYNETGK